ncbi:hypothetical protein CR513_52575, partial [Mucuna pruriens]
MTPQPKSQTMKFYKCIGPHLVNDCQVKGIRQGYMPRYCQGSTKFEPTMNIVRAAKLTASRRVFTMNGAKAFEYENLMLGKCNIVGKLQSVMYDSIATHSFISYN